MARCFRVVFLVLPLLAGCVDLPDLDAAISPQGRAAPYPDLIAIDPILFAPFQGERDSAAEIAWLGARAAGLRQRARALMRPVVDARTRARMTAALERHYPKDT